MCRHGMPYKLQRKVKLISQLVLWFSIFEVHENKNTNKWYLVSALDTRHYEKSN